MNCVISGLVIYIATSVPTMEARRSNTTEVFTLPHIRMGVIPECRFGRLKAQCCANVGLINNHRICLNLDVNMNELKAYKALIVDGTEYYRNELKAGDFCIPIPVLPTFQPEVCLNVYWIDGSIAEKRFEFCSRIAIRLPVLPKSSIDLRCIRFIDGNFTINSNHRPKPSNLY